MKKKIKILEKCNGTHFALWLALSIETTFATNPFDVNSTVTSFLFSHCWMKMIVITQSRHFAMWAWHSVTFSSQLCHFNRMKTKKWTPYLINLPSSRPFPYHFKKFWLSLYTPTSQKPTWFWVFMSKIFKIALENCLKRGKFLRKGVHFFIFIL